jgi:hypothetical protein
VISISSSDLNHKPLLTAMSKFISVESIFSGFENLAVGNTCSPHTLEKIFDVICTRYFVTSKSYKRRKSVDPKIDAAEAVDLKNLGQIFPFVNREEESKELLRCFGRMDLISGRESFEKNKRRLGVPLCLGLPGLEKTRYARIALTSLIQSLTLKEIY